MGKRTPSKWLTLLAACFGLLMAWKCIFDEMIPCAV